MTKQEIHAAFINQICAKLDAVTQAAKQTFATATDEAHHAEGKYDTFSLESSYLARGQAKRVKELTENRDRLQQMQLNSFGKKSAILLSALIELESIDGNDKRTLFFAPCAGGETIEDNGREIMIITSAAPLGKAIFGKKTGDSFEIKLGPIPKTFKITSVK